MNPIRREVLNGLLVLVIASLLSVAFSAFQVSFNALLWVLILMGIAIAVSGYILFEITLGVITSAEDREKGLAESTRWREEEWLKRVGNPARLVSNPADLVAVTEAVKAIGSDSTLTFMSYVSSDGGRESILFEEVTGALENLYRLILEQVRCGTILEFKQIICFDHDVLAKAPELKSGVLRVGEGPGTIDRGRANFYRVLMLTRGCSLYIAPAVLPMLVSLYGSDKISITLETAEQDSGFRNIAGTMFFCDPPNGEIIEQIREMVRTSEKRMVAVHKIVFPEDAEPTADLATR
jgi:hypothetical protein